MPRARRSLTDAEILGMALNTSTARRLQGRWPEAEDRRHDSVVHTAKFLWLALGLTVVALGATFAKNSRASSTFSFSIPDCAP